jgi:hypothetical protein
MKFLTRLLVSGCFLMYISIFSMNNSTALIVNEQVQSASDIIDQHLKIDKVYSVGQGFARQLMGRYYAFNMTGNDIAKELAAINGLTNNALKNPELLPLIMKNNSYINQIVSILPNKIVNEWKNVKGSTIDMFETSTSMFPELAAEQAAEFFDTVILRYKQEFDLDAELALLVRGVTTSMLHLGDEFFNDKTEDGIRNFISSETCLLGHKKPIEKRSLRISKCGKYLYSMDVSKNAIVWDILTASRVGADRAVSLNLEWDSGSKDQINALASNYFADEDYIFSKNKDYCAAVGDFRNREPRYVKDETIIFLYKRPTLAFRLCQLAIMNSKNDSSELQALKISKMFKSVGGFQQQSLKIAIDNCGDIAKTLALIWKTKEKSEGLIVEIIAPGEYRVKRQ